MHETERALTNDEVRRRRLAQLREETPGGLDAIAAAAKVSAQNLDHILKRRLQSKPRADGTRPLVGMGDSVARDIEEGMKLPPGWLDWPFTHVPFEAFLELNAFQRAAVEGQMLAAIKEVRGKKVPAGALKTPVSNKKVEAHYKALPQGAAEAAYRKASATTRIRPKEPTPDLFGPHGEKL